MTGRAVVAVAAVALAMGLSSTSAEAQGPWAWGLRAGFALSPDAFVLGGHGNTEIESVDGLSFEPVVQIGFGSERSISYNTFELAGRARYDLEADADALFYLLGGLVIYRFSIDEIETPIGGFGGSTSDVGLQVGGGVEKNGFGLEGVLGVSGVSDFQFLARWTGF